MKVLLVKLSSLGDVLHAWPAVMEARDRVPGLSLDWCVDRPLAGLVRLLPGVDAVLPSDAYGGLEQLLVPSRWQALRRLTAQLRVQGYDLTIDAQGLLRSAVVARGAAAPVFGFDRRSTREGLATHFVDRQVGIDEHQNAGLRIRLLFGAALGYAPSAAWQAPTLAVGVARPASAFLLTGSSAASKRWPLERWVGLARVLAGRGYLVRTTWSTDAERVEAEALARAVAGLEVVPHQPLERIAQMVAMSGLVVGGDTGLTHFADIAGRPTIMLFSGSDPRLTGPIGRRSRAVSGVPFRGRPRRRDAVLPPAPARLATVDAVLDAIAEVAEPVA